MPAPWNPIEGWDVPRGYWGPDQPTAGEESFWEMIDQLQEMEDADRATEERRQLESAEMAEHFRRHPHG